MSSYTVSSVGASYEFALDEDSGYYVSNNKGVQNSAAVSVVTLTITEVCDVVFNCINYAESNYDFGILSTLNTTLSTTYTADSTNVKQSFKGMSTSAVQTVRYKNVAAGTHTIYVKYRKDSSVDNNNDNFQFNITFEEASGEPTVNIPVKIGGAFKDSDAIYVKIGGSWKSVEAVYVKIGGSWKSQ